MGQFYTPPELIASLQALGARITAIEARLGIADVIAGDVGVAVPRRLLSGQVSSTGTITLAGTGGWTCTRTALGHYTVTYATTFASVAIPVCTPFVNASDLLLLAVTTSNFQILITNSAGTLAVDCGFTFRVDGI